MRRPDTGILLEDPVRNCFFKLPDRLVPWLADWGAGGTSASSRHHPSDDSGRSSRGDPEELRAFLRDNQLLETDHVHSLFAAHDTPKRSLLSKIFHASLFVRIPLLRPQLLLDRAWPYVVPVFSRSFVALTVIAGLLGLWLTSRQWDGFRRTFSDFATLEGMLLYAASLIVLKILHECGHAFMARRYGVPVPRIGLAFMLMTPVLYTDTTGAWRLPRRSRMMIGAGGLMVELAIATYATLAWALLPDGAARSVAFTLATLSWAMSLLVNLNPLMRFDGYYLFSDLIGVDNLQQRGFAMARWTLRKSLFGFADPPPEHLSPRQRSVIVVHAYATWIYRFFLFLAIALLVYHSVAKPLGILLFMTHLALFVGKPILGELKHWYEQRGRFRFNRHTFATTAVLTSLGVALFAPWQGTVRAPAVLRASQVTDLHLASPAFIESVEDTRTGGQRLLSIRATDPDLAHQYEAARARLWLSELRLARIAADTQERHQRQIFAGQVAAARSELNDLNERAMGLRILSAGRQAHETDLAWVSEGLHEGRWIASSAPLGTIVRQGPPVFIGYVAETELERLSLGDRAAFVPDHPESPIRRGEMIDIATAPSAALDLPLLSGVYGGPITVDDVGDRGHVPITPRFAIAVRLDDSGEAPRMELRGTMVAEADRRAPISRYLRHAASVLLREFNF
ncbi:hypothetical protein [Notoacmeibacter marinus]|uniref:hypothetical protein n=1 Tax=Notoacmeibacter marinus TaxID=1876515 RepID=UPI000DF390FF|nr:hypothetical protein [Notoacmeibacter marinus]